MARANCWDRQRSLLGASRLGNGISTRDTGWKAWEPLQRPSLTLAQAQSRDHSGREEWRQCWAQLFGLRSTIAFKALFVLCTWLGAIFEAQAVLDFGDLMVLGMAFPNITGVLLLSGKIRTDLEMYLERLRAGEFARHRELAM